MIAATASSSDRIFDIVLLALQVRAKNQALSRQLQAYLDGTVQTALRLLDHVEGEVATASPEAVSLAVALKRNEELTRAFRDLAEAGGAQAAAQEALDVLGAEIDANHKPAYFSREVYAAI